MAQVHAYQADQRLAPISGAKQRAPSVGFGEGIGEGLQGLGRSLGQAAEAVDVYNTKVDEATVKDLDATFAETERTLRTRLSQAKGKDALIEAPLIEQEFQTARDKLLGSATGERQRGMLTQVLNARQARFSDGVATYRGQELETFTNDSEKADISAKTQDVLSFGVDDPDRMVAMQATAGAIRARGARLGWDEVQTKQALLDASTGIHTQTVAQLIEAGDPRAAKSYLDANRTQIDPAKLTQLNETVRTQVYEFDAQSFWDKEPEADPDHEIEAPAADGSGARSFTLRPPVSANMGSRFGPRSSPGGVGSSNHKGVDYPVPVNTPITASGPGTVRLRTDPNGYGQYVVVDHGNGWETRYAHVSAFQVRDGQTVDAGEVLALSGGARGAAGAGNSQGPHVHYEVRHNGAAVDPASEIGQSIGGGAQQARAASAQPRTLEDVYTRAEQAAGGDWRYRRILEQRGAQAYGQQRAIKADAEQAAWDAVQPYLPDGATPASSVSQIPGFSSLSPQQQNMARGQLRSAAEGEAHLDPVASDATFNSLMDLAASPTTTAQFRALNLDEYAPVLGRSRVNTLKATQRTMRNETPPQNATLAGRTTSALSGMTTLRNRYLSNIGVETGEKATPEDARTTAQFNDAITRSVSTFIATNQREPTETEMTGMMSNLTRQVLPNGTARTGFLGLGGPETRRAFEGGPAASAIPSDDRSAILDQFKKAGVARPTESQIDAAYRLGLNRGTFQPPRANR